MENIKKCTKCNTIAKITQDKDTCTIACECGNEGTHVFCNMTEEQAIRHYNISIPSSEDIMITIKITEDNQIYISAPSTKSNEGWEIIKEKIELCRENMIEALKTFAKD